MSQLHKHRDLLIEGAFLLMLFFVSRLPLRDFDIWFHIKSGELFLSQGFLSVKEVFSHAAYGREWITFEWLFQILSYQVSRIGLWAIPYWISGWVVLGYFFLFRILGDVYKTSLLTRLVLAFVFWVSTYEFNTARPHTVAYTFLIIHIYLILARIYLHKRWLWYSPILTLIWTNMHSTGFLSWGFLLAFSLTLYLQWAITKIQSYKQTAHELLVLMGINGIITLLPPMGLADYRLLWRFFTEREFLGYFISEWGSPQDNPFGFTIYSTSVAVTFILAIGIAIWERKSIASLTALPFVVMILVGYTATRNIYLGTLGLCILFGSSIEKLIHKINVKHKYWVTILLTTIAIGFYLWVYSLKYNSVYTNRLYYPLQATEFIKSQRLSGNMFNDYNYGSYMLYRLYPDQHVFIDGRADVYECCEMRDYLQLAANKHMKDEAYRQFLDTLWKKYDISYAVIVTTKHNVMRRISTLLMNDSQWSLVFWDDDSQIFVRKDGKNNRVIEKFGTTASTPYLRNPYIPSQEQVALAEYEHMYTIAKSARTSNTIGYIHLKNNRFPEAKARFEEARLLDPTFESPYMNLAELAAKDGDLDHAIMLYQKAQRLAPDRGLIYIRLGELVQTKTNDGARVRKIWQDGLNNTIDEDAKNKLRTLLRAQ